MLPLWQDLVTTNIPPTKALPESVFISVVTRTEYTAPIKANKKIAIIVLIFVRFFSTILITCVLGHHVSGAIYLLRNFHFFYVNHSIRNSKNPLTRFAKEHV